MRRRLARALIQGAKLSVSTATSNGEVEGPPRSADQARRAHNVFPRPRRTTTHASRPPPTIVRRHVEVKGHLASGGIRGSLLPVPGRIVPRQAPQ